MAADGVDSFFDKVPGTKQAISHGQHAHCSNTSSNSSHSTPHAAWLPLRMSAVTSAAVLPMPQPGMLGALVQLQSPIAAPAPQL
jgi:hypothetical protein